MDETSRFPVEKRCLILMSKFPEEGRVKTRLAVEIGSRHASELSGCFVQDLLQSLSSEAWSCRLALYPWDKREAMADIVGKAVIQVPQRGNDLGERMEGVFADAFSGGMREVVIIGNDVPDLPPDVVAEAFESLADHDAVLGPACDGGYYLVGFHRETCRDHLFDDLPWGTPEIFSRQMRRFRDQNLRVYILPSWRDVDTLADLANLFRLAGMTSFAGSRTMAYLRSSDVLGKGKAAT